MGAGAELFGRRATLQMGTVLIDGLRVSFKVEKTGKPEPNTAEISVWNLARNTRSSLLNQVVPLILQAGYEGSIEQVFSGDIRADGISVVRNGADWVTTFKAGDGERAFRTSQIQASFGKGTPLRAVLQQLAGSMRVGLGNAAEKIKKGDVHGELTGFVNGATLSGPSSQEMTRLCDSLGYDWHIHDGQLFMLEKGTGALQEQAVMLSSSSGLVGSPEPGKDGFTKFRSLLQPRIRPGCKVQLQTASVNGFFVVHKVTHTGDTHSSDWYSDCEGRPL